MLAYLLSKPSDWVVQPKALQGKGAGRDKVYNILKELIDQCYIQRDYTRSKGVVTGVEYLVFERPYTIISPFPEKPDTASPDTAKAYITEDRVLDNTDSLSDDKTPPSKKSEKLKTYSDRLAAGKPGKADPVLRALAIHLFKAADNPQSITSKEGRAVKLLSPLFKYEQEHCPDTAKLYDHIVALVPGYAEYCLKHVDEIVTSEIKFPDYWDRYRQAGEQNKPAAVPVSDLVDDPDRPGVLITRDELARRKQFYSRETR